MRVGRGDVVGRKMGLYNLDRNLVLTFYFAKSIASVFSQF